MYDEQRNQLQRILDLENDLVYGFLATGRGRLLCEVGSKPSLPESSVVEISLAPKSIRSFYLECLRYAKEDPRMIPRLYGQGRTKGVIGPPSKGLLVAVFGVMPEKIYAASPEIRVHWLASFRKRIWTTVTAVFQ